MNRTWHGAIKKTPYEVVFGMEMRRNEIVPLGLRADMEIEDEGVNDNEDNEYGSQRDFEEEQQLPDLQNKNSESEDFGSSIGSEGITLLLRKEAELEVSLLYNEMN